MDTEWETRGQENDEDSGEYWINDNVEFDFEEETDVEQEDQWSKQASGIRWLLYLFSKIIELYKISENYVLLNLVASQLQKFAFILAKIQEKMERQSDKDFKTIMKESGDRKDRKSVIISFQLRALVLANECYQTISSIDCTEFPSLLEPLPSESLAQTPNLSLKTETQDRRFSPLGLFPLRSASYVAKKTMPRVYFKWAELLYIHATVLEKMNSRTKKGDSWDRKRDSKGDEAEYLRHIAGKKYRIAFEMSELKSNENDRTVNFNLMKKRTETAKSIRDPREWVLKAFPNVEKISDNVNLATVMDLYRRNSSGVKSKDERDEELTSSSEKYIVSVFDSDWLPPDCHSDEVFLIVVKNCSLKKLLLRERDKDVKASTPRNPPTSAPSKVTAVPSGARAISLESLVKAGSMGCLTELDTLVVRAYEDLTDSYVEQIIKAQCSSLHTIVLDGCNITDKSITYLATTFGQNLRCLFGQLEARMMFFY